MAVESKKWKKISVDKLIFADWNYKENDEARAEKLKNNIKRNGQIENVIVRRLETGFYEVVNGNHRLEVFKELGQKKIVCFSLGKISDAQAKRVAVETNETRFGTNDVKMAEVLDEIISDGTTVEELVETMPFTEQQLKGYLDLNEFDFDVEVDDTPREEKEEVPGETTPCPECGHHIRL